jgi:hypothetical protein
MSEKIINLDADANFHMQRTKCLGWSNSLPMQTSALESLTETASNRNGAMLVIRASLRRVAAGCKDVQDVGEIAFSGRLRIK